MKRQNRIIEIPFSEDMLERAEHFTREVVKEKRKEKVHQRDGKNEYKRWVTGTLGELALEEFLGVRIHNPTVGHSSRYAVPNLSSLGIPVGVKSFRVGNFPLVNRIAQSPSPFTEKSNLRSSLASNRKGRSPTCSVSGFPRR